jgi:hypothetical protein
LVPCFAGEFNQAILNIVVNAAHAVGDVVARTDANDLLDSRDVFVQQPYRGGHAPLPGVGRQVLLVLGYAWER